VGREAVFTLRGAGLVSLDIEGDLAAIAPLLPQRLVVRVGGHEALNVLLTHPGPFSLTVPLTANGGRPGAWEVSLVPERTFRAREDGPVPDHRDLSVRLLRLVAHARDGSEIIKTLGPTPCAGGAR
jgi:hypothetical protein